MEALKNSKNMTIVGAVVIVALALVFWTQLLSPKREEAAKLGDQIETVEPRSRRTGLKWRKPKRRADGSRPSTSGWSCWARPFPAATKRPRCSSS